MLREGIALIVIVLSFVVPQLAQDIGHQRHVSPNYPALDGPKNSPQPTPEEQRIRQQAAQDLARQNLRQLQLETAQLATLASQLKAEVDKTAASTLSVSAIKKTQQIEKLAKDIRTKMKGM